jgi:hypothetical protein
MMDMKMVLAACGWLAMVGAAGAAEEPLRVAVLAFENQASSIPASVPTDAVSNEALAEKGVFLLNKKLSGAEGFRLVDRRDFFAQMEKQAVVEGQPMPSFLRAAQQVQADVVLRGSLLAVSSSRSSVHQGGYKAFLDDFSVRVGLEALDTRDGSVLAAADGVASRRFRQTDNMTSVIGEDDVLQLMEGALEDTLPAMREALARRAEELRAKPTARLTIATSDDPALLEIDGMLIGSTPVTDFVLYQGDHTLTIDKPGYRKVSKRILVEQDTRIEVPMLRTELTADEVKDVLDKAKVSVFSGAEPALIIHAE